MTPIRDQSSLGSCTAHALSAIVEYFNKIHNASVVPISTRYSYKKTRDLAHELGDTGAYLRTTMKSLVTYGWVREQDWAYDVKNFDVTIPQELVDIGELNQAIAYLRVDYNNLTTKDLLVELKKVILKEIPIMFGFACYQSLYDSNTNGGKIPFPAPREAQIGGHAVAICGYDDNITIVNKNGNIQSKGALIIKNSWGSKWANKGFGYPPYDYVIQGLATDFWYLLSLEWMNEKAFD